MAEILEIISDLRRNERQVFYNSLWHSKSYIRRTLAVITILSLLTFWIAVWISFYSAHPKIENPFYQDLHLSCQLRGGSNQGGGSKTADGSRQAAN